MDPSFSISQRTACTCSYEHAWTTLSYITRFYESCIEHTLALKSESKSTLDDFKSLWITGGLQCSWRYSNPLWNINHGHCVYVNIREALKTFLDNKIMQLTWLTYLATSTAIFIRRCQVKADPWEGPKMQILRVIKMNRDKFHFRSYFIIVPDF